MNELDLSPFKVEFDRDIHNDDVIEGDFVKISDGIRDRLLLAKRHHNYDYDFDGYTIAPDEYEGDTLWFESDELPRNASWRTKKESIKAIYRINKFKY